MREERWVIHYSGRVQGVGFRATTRNLSKFHAVKGYVKNLWDGRVEVVVEGDVAQLERFVAQIQETMARYIDGRECEKKPSSGEFPNFEIR